MNRFLSNSRYRIFIAAMLLSTLVAGCGGQDPILGGQGVAGRVPTVTTETPANKAIGVATSTTMITATFSEPVAGITGGATFTLTCAAPCADATGTVSLDGTNTIATFTLTPGTMLEPLVSYTATITGVKGLASGLAMTGPFVWNFVTTGTVANTTRPQVASTDPV